MNPSPDDRAIAVWYEHPEWFRSLFAELDWRGMPYEPLHAAEHRYDPGETEARYALVFNRMSPSAHLRGHADAIFYTTHFLDHLERLGVRVINGAAAWRTEISKARQLSLLASLGLPSPRARVIHDSRQAPEAAAGLRFPVVLKPNVGGSGAGIRRFEDAGSLRAAAADGAIDLGIDSTALVQEFVPAESGRIVRVEMLDGELLYAIRVYTSGETFDLCPADLCRDVDGAELERPAVPTDAPKNDLRVEGYEPPGEVVEAVRRILAASEIEIGGVEYMIDERDGEVVYYDVNALSNFVADAPRVVGFDPFARLVDWLERELGRVPAGKNA